MDDLNNKAVKSHLILKKQALLNDKEDEVNKRIKQTTSFVYFVSLWFKKHSMCYVTRKAKLGCGKMWMVRKKQKKSSYFA